jgi:hypothetical protein
MSYEIRVVVFGDGSVDMPGMTAHRDPDCGELPGDPIKAHLDVSGSVEKLDIPGFYARVGEAIAGKSGFGEYREALTGAGFYVDFEAALPAPERSKV